MGAWGGFLGWPRWLQLLAAGASGFAALLVGVGLGAALPGGNPGHGPGVTTLILPLAETTTALTSTTSTTSTTVRPPTTAPASTTKPTLQAPPTTTTTARVGCSPAYPTICVPPPPPDLDCGDIPHRRFAVLPPDPHRFDGNDDDGIGCESP